MSERTGIATGPMVITAVERFRPEAERIVDNPMATALLPRAAWPQTVLTRWRTTRRIIERATERLGDGLYASFLCRKCYLDDQLASAVEQPLLPDDGRARQPTGVHVHPAVLRARGEDRVAVGRPWVR